MYFTPIPQRGINSVIMRMRRTDQEAQYDRRNWQNTLLDGVKEDMARNGKLRYVDILCLDKAVFSRLVVLALPLQARATAL